LFYTAAAPTTTTIRIHPHLASPLVTSHSYHYPHVLMHGTKGQTSERRDIGKAEKGDNGEPAVGAAAAGGGR
jgi:hypothetical protein